MHNRKTSAYLPRNKHYFAFNRKTSAYFPFVGYSIQEIESFPIYIPISMPMPLSNRHIFKEKHLKTEPFALTVEVFLRYFKSNEHIFKVKVKLLCKKKSD